MIIDMGKVKLETINDGRNNHEWDTVNLSSINNIYILIKNRSIFEESYISKQFTNKNPLFTDGIPQFVENIICIYVDLDSYIKKIKFSKMQNIILKYVMLGFSFKDISIIIEKKLDILFPPFRIKEFLLYICRRILHRVKYDYEIWTETSEYKKIKSTSKFAQCCSCKEYHNLKNLYIVNNLSNNTYYYCKNCKSFTDWKRTLKKKYEFIEK